MHHLWLTLSFSLELGNLLPKGQTSGQGDCWDSLQVKYSPLPRSQNFTSELHSLLWVRFSCIGMCPWMLLVCLDGELAYCKKATFAFVAPPSFAPCTTHHHVAPGRLTRRKCGPGAAKTLQPWPRTTFVEFLQTKRVPHSCHNVSFNNKLPQTFSRSSLFCFCLTCCFYQIPSITQWLNVKNRGLLVALMKCFDLDMVDFTNNGGIYLEFSAYKRANLTI